MQDSEWCVRKQDSWIFSLDMNSSLNYILNVSIRQDSWSIFLMFKTRFLVYILDVKTRSSTGISIQHYSLNKSYVTFLLVQGESQNLHNQLAVCLYSTHRSLPYCIEQIILLLDYSMSLLLYTWMIDQRNRISYSCCSLINRI